MADGPSSLFLTVGSTLFADLTDLTLSPAFFDTVLLYGITSLVVQLGKAPTPDLAVLRADPRYSDAQQTGDKEGSFSYRSPDDRNSRQLAVRWMRYTGEFEREVERASAVISHAGSGSILTVLRMPRPLLVVPNSSLMDNHQAQLAEALQADNYLMTSSIQDLLRDLPQFLRAVTSGAQAVSPAFKPFPPVQKGAFASILDETAGYAA